MSTFKIQLVQPLLLSSEEKLQEVSVDPLGFYPDKTIRKPDRILGISSLTDIGRYGHDNRCGREKEADRQSEFVQRLAMSFNSPACPDYISCLYARDISTKKTRLISRTVSKFPPPSHPPDAPASRPSRIHFLPIVVPGKFHHCLKSSRSRLPLQPRIRSSAVTSLWAPNAVATMIWSAESP